MKSIQIPLSLDESVFVEFPADMTMDDLDMVISHLVSLRQDNFCHKQPEDRRGHRGAWRIWTTRKKGTAMNPSKIETLDCWPDRKGFTWNPITGCSKISPGCKNCWAERMACRLKGRYGYPADEPFRPTFHSDRLDEPGKRTKPAAIAVGWMGDLFHPRFTMSSILQVFRVMARHKRHMFFVLTKRPDLFIDFLERAKTYKSTMAWYFRKVFDDIPQWPFPNVAVGVSVESADYLHRIDELLQIPAAMRFVSCEPLLGYIPGLDEYLYSCRACGGNGMGNCGGCPGNLDVPDRPSVDWVAVGGESGPGARPMRMECVRSIRNQCAEADTPFMFKQKVDGRVKTSLPKLDGAKHAAYPKWFGRIEAGK